MRFPKNFAAIAIAGLLMAVPGFGKLPAPAPANQADLEKSVNHAIQTLAWYGVFDDLSFQVDADGHVTLTGQVARPIVKIDAEAAVKHLPGVTSVDDQIEVLPLSPFDDNIRLRAYAAIYGSPALSRYAINARPPIRILVKNGRVTLTGFVSSEVDRRLAEIRVRSLPFIFEVTNNLVVESAPASGT